MSLTDGYQSIKFHFTNGTCFQEQTQMGIRVSIVLGYQMGIFHFTNGSQTNFPGLVAVTP